MIDHAFVASLHYFAAIGVIIGLIYERVTFRQELSIVDAKRIQKADMIYGISAILVLAFGFMRIFWFEKGSDFYFNSPFFYVKLGAFTLVGLLSIYPTVKFFQWNKKLKMNEKPVITSGEYSSIKWVINLEIMGIVIMILSASAMAKGIGF